MARKKVNLKYIVSDYIRRITLKKRRKGIIKKAAELSTLCEIPACVVIYEPGVTDPVVWPDEKEARRILTDFRSLPEMQQRRKMSTREDVFKKLNGKMDEKLTREMREARDAETTALLNMGLAGMSLDDLQLDQANNLTRVINTRIKAVQEQLRKLNPEKAITTAEQVSGKLPMHADVDASDQLEMLMAQIATSESMEALVGPVAESARNNCWLTDVAVQEWLEKEKAKEVVPLSAKDKGKAPMYPEPVKALTSQSTPSTDIPVVDEQTTILDDLDGFDIGGFDDDIMKCMDTGSPWNDLEDLF